MTRARASSQPSMSTDDVALPGGSVEPALITRRRLREDVRDAVLAMITGGELEPGSRIKEAGLAARLGVSRTPLREALMSLEKEGFLGSKPSRGFSVLPLTAEEVRQTYPIISSLEALALDLAKVEDVNVARLRELNGLLTKSSNPDESKQLDTEFHATLVQAAGNPRLSQLLDTMKLVARRYEAVHMGDERLVKISRRQHAGIVRACAGGDLGKAAELVEAHWRFGMESLLERLGADHRPLPG